MNWKSLCAVSALAVVAASSASAGVITNIGFTGSNNINSALIAQFPTGTITPSNSYGVSFSVPASGNNFYDGGSTLVISGLSLTNVTDIYTLMNAYAPVQGATIGTITFRFSDTTFVSFDLIGGSNVRDFYQGLFANTLTSPTAQNAYTYTNVRGAGGTGNVNTGSIGTYVIDEQDFNIAAQAAGKTLVEIDLARSGSGSNGTPILLGLSANSQAPLTGTPEPSTLVLMGAGLGFAAMLRRRF